MDLTIDSNNSVLNYLNSHYLFPKVINKIIHEYAYNSFSQFKKGWNITEKKVICYNDNYYFISNNEHYTLHCIKNKLLGTELVLEYKILDISTNNNIMFILCKSRIIIYDMNSGKIIKEFFIALNYDYISTNANSIILVNTLTQSTYAYDINNFYFQNTLSHITKKIMMIICYRDHLYTGHNEKKFNLRIHDTNYNFVDYIRYNIPVRKFDIANDLLFLESGREILIYNIQNLRKKHVVLRITLPENIVTWCISLNNVITLITKDTVISLNNTFAISDPYCV